MIMQNTLSPSCTSWLNISKNNLRNRTTKDSSTQRDGKL
jgi:hypothetical protein